MKLAIWTYTRESLCRCGYRILRDEIKTGKQYEVDEDSIGPGTWICGGCNESRRIQMVKVRDGTGRFFPLPISIFDRPETIQ